ncbi:hypothetical protein SpiGrapes_0153 [Sphaerochaeta pleomorpha str. Grapes]|uniref:Uncharacterized protein n=1 Tax=Sphaerochaeta pleomorpha (strain ATCC BAA-1885 / DSM 22778 / Grapes) TaxID=158190 RepID=G8QTQ2_SPHPG|nr:hypothetical protein [Sphaerochaeta pleomorpha]AEV28017.1 hypothetical protein SpiGrapes_0153 [Sphaerochaeta pleomorpha str. Grapes]
MKVKPKKNRRNRHSFLFFLMVLLFCFFYFPSCGIYHSAPALPPFEENPVWSGPMLSDAENVRVYFVPKKTTITFNTKEIDTNVNLLLNEYRESGSVEGEAIEELSVQVPEPGSYVLVIKKTSL